MVATLISLDFCKNVLFLLPSNCVSVVECQNKNPKKTNTAFQAVQN